MLFICILYHIFSTFYITYCWKCIFFTNSEKISDSNTIVQVAILTVLKFFLFLRMRKAALKSSALHVTETILPILRQSKKHLAQRIYGRRKSRSRTLQWIILPRPEKRIMMLPLRLWTRGLMMLTSLLTADWLSVIKISALQEVWTVRQTTAVTAQVWQV